MKHLFPIRLARPAALVLLASLVFVLGMSGTAWAGLGDSGSNRRPVRQGTVPPRSADLSIVKTGTWVNREITFTLMISNAGPIAASEVMAVDNVPNSLLIKSVTPSQGTCQIKNNATRCTLGNLATGGTATVTIVAQPKRRTLRSVVNVAVVGSRTRDSNYQNNISSTLVTRP